MKSNDTAALHRHDLTDEAWARIEPLLPGRCGQWGGIARDNRRFVNAVLWIVCAGAPWRDLPPDYGGWSNTHRRFIRCRDAGVWERILEAVVDDPDMEWLMVDATYVKAQRHAARAAGGGPRGGGTQKYIWPWIHLVLQSESLSLKVQSLTARRLCR